MYLIWFFLYCTQPALIFLGLFGLFGDTGKRAAYDVAAAWMFIIVIAAIVVGIYHFLKFLGLI